MPMIDIPIIEDRTERSIANAPFAYDKKYNMVSNKTMKVCNVNFTKNVIVTMTGLMALACIRKGEGHVSEYNPKVEQAKTDANDFEEMKKQIAELKAEKESVKKEPVVKEDIAPSTVKKPASKSKKAKK